ncbi:hypothetical protein OQA88_2680 [Cercophora sp. LCS_1]
MDVTDIISEVTTIQTFVREKHSPRQKRLVGYILRDYASAINILHCLQFVLGPNHENLQLLRPVVLSIHTAASRISSGLLILDAITSTTGSPTQGSLDLDPFDRFQQEIRDLGFSFEETKDLLMDNISHLKEAEITIAKFLHLQDLDPTARLELVEDSSITP